MNTDQYDELWMFSTDDEEEKVPDMPVLKRGRKPLTDKFPQLAPAIEKFIADNSAEAHNRRRTETSYSHGVSLEEIRRHVIRQIPGLNTISRTTIHRMMKPARQGTINAKRHSGLIDARIPPKRNNATLHHQDFRYTCAGVNYMTELVTLFDKECALFSCDDKNKVNVGTLAVSRHFQIRKFFSRNDQPNYPDHDFPYANSKLIPSGYMRLQHKRRTRSLSRESNMLKNKPQRSRSTSPPKRRHNCENIYRDSNGREKVSWPRTGNLDVYLQAGKFHGSNSQLHTEHLYQLLSPIVKDPVNPRTVIAVLADGGPDWSTKSVINLLNFGRLWRDLQLDGLIVACYAPRHSRFNPIERAWAPLSKWLTGVTLPRTLDGERFPPIQQSDLSDEEVEQKESEVFDKAISICAKYWDGKQFDGFPITVHQTPCLPQTNNNRHTDHDEIRRFVDSSASQIVNNDGLSNLQKELRFFVDHCVRRTYQLELYKCEQDTCTHCSTYPVVAREFFNTLSSFGGKLPSPVPDSSRSKGEYMTLLRLLKTPCYGRNFPDANLPSGIRGTCETCDYVFVSAADKKRHHTLLHSKKFR